MLKHYHQKAVNPYKTWCCAKKSVCLEDNINNEKSSPAWNMSPYRGFYLKPRFPFALPASHLGSAHLEKAARAEHMFRPKGPGVLNCHACILCGTKGAYVKNEQWIRVSARATETKRESKSFGKHRWLSLASVLVLHKCFEDVLFFPRPPDFSFSATVLLFCTVFIPFILSTICSPHTAAV